MSKNEEACLDHGKPVDIQHADGTIRIKPLRNRRYDLNELLASVPANYQAEEWDIGPPVGREVW